MTALAAAFILYGSLYPLQFRQLSDDAEPFAVLLSSWGQLPGSRGDLIANLFLYAPLGLFFAVYLSGRLRWPALVGLVALCGALLSSSMEIAQVYIAGRTSSTWDILLNTAGCFLGALASAIGANRLSAALNVPKPAVQPFVVLLVLSWLGYRLYPYVPTIDLLKYWASLKPLFLTPAFEPFRSFRLAVLWLVAAHLIEMVTQRWFAYPIVAAALLGTLAAGVFIVDKVLTLADVLGVGFALLARAMLRASAWHMLVLPWLLLAVVTADRLAPFDFSSVDKPFGWVPFLSVLRGHWGLGLQSMFEKVFLYGSLLWLLVQRGLPLPLVAGMEMGLLFATSLAQTRIPGRSAEITDTVLAAGIAIVFALLRTGPEEVRLRQSRARAGTAPTLYPRAGPESFKGSVIRSCPDES
jgi:VanZ family protein